MVKEFSTNTNLLAFNKEMVIRDMDELIRVYAPRDLKNLDLNFCEMMRPDSRLNDSRAKEYIETLKREREEYNLNFVGSHAPYPVRGTAISIWDEKIKRAIEYAEELKCPYIVIHPIKGSIEENAEYYSKFIPYTSNILIAIENMESKEEISRYFEIKEIISSSPTRLKALFDTGHANVMGLDLKKEILGYGDDLVGLHIHDNDGIQDQHLLPFMGNINWKEVLSGLEEIDYKGYLTYEAMFYARSFSIKDEYKVIDDAIEAFNSLLGKMSTSL